jgi:hypothetical protein
MADEILPAPAAEIRILNLGLGPAMGGLKGGNESRKGQSTPHACCIDKPYRQLGSSKAASAAAWPEFPHFTFFVPRL